jgi:hypothetical protein
MGQSNPSICIQCGHSTDHTQRLNRLEDGRVCTICRDRLLEQLPPLVPTLSYAEAEVEAGAAVVPIDPDPDPASA